MAILTQQTLMSVIEEVGLIVDYQEALLASLRKSIRVTATEPIADESKLPVGSSKIGGLPDLPPDVDWPHWHDKSLSFVAQINLADVASLDHDSLLPSQGLLSFFYNGYQWLEGEPFEPGMWEVIFTDIAVSPLQTLSEPLDFGEYNTLYQPYRLKFDPEITLPPIISYYGFKRLGYSYRNGIDEHLEEVLRRVDEIMYSDADYTRSRLLGHPDQIQGDVFLEAEEARRGEKISEAEIYDDPTSGITDWQLLFQLDSEEEAGMMWGDVGRLYYCIRQTDLKARAFEKTICTMQCS